MAHLYRASGKLDHPVSDLAAAREYLDEPMEDYVYPDALKEAVFTIRWDLSDEDTWFVLVYTHRALTPEESTELSSWISGQNSDGLGEGFEQQRFAEFEPKYNRWGDRDDEEDPEYASFDWQTNDCSLTLIK
jgi:hypothetical protein